ncbi:MAG: transposase [Acidobacteriia bacterium]|nr:transposase [Terriglobia bacterium]
MGHSYASNFIHCVFSTKDRANLIPEQRSEQLYAYILGIAKNIGIGVLCIGGTANHLHILLALPANRTLSDAVRDLKANSSRWMSEAGLRFAWQHGFGAFSVSPSQLPVVKNYIHGQAEHHKKRNFEEEFLALLRKSGVEFDPTYVFG